MGISDKIWSHFGDSCALSDDFLVPKRRRPNTSRKIKLTDTLVLKDIRHCYANMLINVFNVGDSCLLRNFIQTFAIPELYVEDGYAAGLIASTQPLIQAKGCDEVANFVANHFDTYPDYILTVLSVQLRRRGETGRSYSVLRLVSRYTSIKTMQEEKRYLTMVLVISEQNLVEAVYSTADFTDPAVAEEQSIYLIWKMKESWNL